MTNLCSLVEQVMTAVRAAADSACKASFSIKEKEGESYNIVTSSDIAVQHYLQKALVELLPGSGFVGEEEGQNANNQEYYWIVDPIDGTTNFARHLQQSSISVALAKNKELLLGVVYNFDRDDMYWAVKGNGAYRNGKKLMVSNKDFSHSIICTALCLYRKQFTRVCAEALVDFHLQCADFRRFGTASLEMSYLGEGNIDGYFELRLYPWDFAAATVIIREAGGVVATANWPKDGSLVLSDELILDRPSTIIAANNKENLIKISQIVFKHMGTIGQQEYIDNISK